MVEKKDTFMAKRFGCSLGDTNLSAELLLENKPKLVQNAEKNAGLDKF